MRTRLAGLCLLSAGYLFSNISCGFAAETPTVELALTFRPVQKDIEYDTPPASDFSKCEVKVEVRGKMSGWVVLGVNGQPIRRFVDTNGDNVVDQWRYYQHGLEVYRDMDTNFNNKVDQSRWLTTAGSRWGIDSNEDGRIDSWKILSAEEAARLAILALISNDESALSSVLLNANDIRQMGLKPEPAKALLERVSGTGAKIREVSTKSRMITPQTTWMRFDSSMPGIIPVEEGKADQELMVYENAMAFVETGGEPGLMQIGEMIRVGDVWKLTQIPRPIEPNQMAEAGILMQPDFNVATTEPVARTGSPEMQKVLKELQDLDQNSPSPTAGRSSLANYNSKRADLLTQLIAMTKTEEERNQWVRQMVDGIASAVQTGAYPEGLERLKSLEADTARQSPKSPMRPYIQYRRMLAEYSVSIQKADGDSRQKVQEQWLDDLRKFAKDFPQSEDAPEAILQLAISEEFAGKLSDAREWYDRLMKDYSDAPAAARARGAVRRLDLVGTSLTLSGAGLKGGTVDVAQFRGKPVLVLFWATWCTPCTEDLPQIRALYEQYREQGFEIVGVNLDTTVDPVQPYLTEHRVTWPQIFEPGGLDNAPAREFGVLTVPTMFLVDAKGIVQNRNASVKDLKEFLADTYKKD